jgi:hypothetical protein
MKFHRIFGNKLDCNFWSVCYREDKIRFRWVDIFRKLFNKWNDTEELLKFFQENEVDLRGPFWNGISIDEAIDKVQDEAIDFEQELKCIETKQPQCADIELKDIFQNLHEKEFILIPGNEKHRKGKPNSNPPMLRIYALELDDGSYVVTGGGIKLTNQMNDALTKELSNLKRVQQFLKAEGVFNKEGLEDFESK